MEKEICVRLRPMPRSWAMAGSAAAVMLALIKVTSCPAETTMRMDILRQGDQLYGFRNSSDASQIACRKNWWLEPSPKTAIFLFTKGNQVLTLFASELDCSGWMAGPW